MAMGGLEIMDLLCTSSSVMFNLQHYCSRIAGHQHSNVGPLPLFFSHQSQPTWHPRDSGTVLSCTYTRHYFTNQICSYYVLIRETRTQTLILYVVGKNIDKAGCARTQWNNVFAVSC